MIDSPRDARRVNPRGSNSDESDRFDLGRRWVTDGSLHSPAWALPALLHPQLDLSLRDRAPLHAAYRLGCALFYFNFTTSSSIRIMAYYVYSFTSSTGSTAMPRSPTTCSVSSGVRVVYIYIYVYLSVCVCIYIYMCVCVCVCVYICVWVCVHISG